MPKNKKENKICASIEFFPDKSKTYIQNFIINKIRNLKEYKNPEPILCEDIIDFISQFISIIDDGMNNNYLPIIIGYDIYSNFRTIIHEFQTIFNIKILAQNENNIYSLELLFNDNSVLKFWDIKHLCDFNMILSYSKYDYIAYAIPDFLKSFLKQNNYIEEKDLGTFLLTKSSMTRIYARKFIGTLYYINYKQNKIKLSYANRLTCIQNQPKDFIKYCLRKSCFNGGFNFVSNKRACKVYTNVKEIDVTSMHHAQLCGHYIPVEFRDAKPEKIWQILYYLKNKDINYFLKTYSRPFTFAFNAHIGLTNIRLKNNSIFKKEKISLIQREKFVSKYVSNCQSSNNLIAEENIKNYGFKWSCEDANFSFNKLNYAKKITIDVNEVEFFNICQVYDFDEVVVYFGEISSKFKRPSDFVTLQTNIFYRQKQAVKNLIEEYRVNKPFKKRIPLCIPDYMKEKIKQGKLPKNEIKKFYQIFIKAKFNSVYGNQAQDVYKPFYTLNKNADILIDNKSIMRERNFDKKIKDKESNLSVNYIYGTRISAFSRTHLILAMILMYKYDENIKIISGDTDSIRFTSNKKDIMKSLIPLHKATKKAIEHTLYRVKSTFPKQYCNMKKLGYFEIANTYWKRIDYANKMYITCNKKNNISMTFAGFDVLKIQEILQILVKKKGFEFVVNNFFGYNTTIDKSLVNLYEFNKPNKYYINNHPTITWKKKVNLNLLSTFKQENLENILNLSYFNNNKLDNPKFIYNNYIEIIDNTGEINKYEW